ncbi:MAG TPA: hypothetical protein VNF07_06370 [Acidimicrobiales bacterium]|nr:hypothetical protein [Acidimicrobiales bacterium]
MHRRRLAALAGGLSLTLSFGGLALTGGASAAVHAPTATHCVLAQERVDLVAAVQRAVAARQVLLQHALTLATANDNGTRVQKIDARLGALSARQAKLSSRLAALEQRCSVAPG